MWWCGSNSGWADPTNYQPRAESLISRVLVLSDFGGRSPNERQLAISVLSISPGRGRMEESSAGSLRPDPKQCDCRQHGHAHVHEEGSGHLLSRNHTVALGFGVPSRPAGRHPRNPFDTRPKEVSWEGLQGRATRDRALRMIAIIRWVVSSIWVDLSLLTIPPVPCDEYNRQVSNSGKDCLAFAISGLPSPNLESTDPCGKS